jgi:DNA repair exonuclease SbcCD ATPase subunit
MHSVPLPRWPRIFRSDHDEKHHESLQTALASAQRDLSQAKREHDSARKEFSQVEQILNNTKSSAASLTTFLGCGVSGPTDHSSLCLKAAELMVELEDVEYRLSEAKDRTQPAALSRVERECADAHLNLEHLNARLNEMRQRIASGRRELFMILTSEDWAKASEAETERQIADRIYKHLKSEMKHAAGNADPPVPTAPTCHVHAGRARLIRRKLELELQIHEATIERACAQIRRKVTIGTLLDDLAKLDAALRALGLEGLNLKELKQKHLPEGPLTPLKRPMSSAAALPAPAELAHETGKRSHSDLKRPIQKTRV